MTRRGVKGPIQGTGALPAPLSGRLAVWSPGGVIASVDSINQSAVKGWSHRGRPLLSCLSLCLTWRLPREAGEYPA